MSKRCSSTKFAWTSWHQRQYNYILEFHRLHFYSYFHPSLFPPRPFSVVNWWSKWISRDWDQFSPPALRLIIVAVQWRQRVIDKIGRTVSTIWTLLLLHCEFAYLCKFSHFNSCIKALWSAVDSGQGSLVRHQSLAN